MSSRREFLKTAGAAVAGGLAAGPARAAPGPEAYGVSSQHAYESGRGSMMYMPGHSMIGARTEPRGAPADNEVEYREFDLSFDLIEHELLPGVKFPVFAFNGMVPGPLFRVQENDWVKVNVKNRGDAYHSLARR
jgi:FtsP/CotA-like multicopper oxidase with cupredoxin domain